MTTNSDAYFARTLEATLKKKHPDFQLESVKGSRIGAGSMRVIHLKHSGGKFAQFPFPRKGIHAGETSRLLYETACTMLRLEPVKDDGEIGEGE
ncbi:hypothetical protein ACYPKM_02530 [Pseudomonas aeruginosa]